METVAINTPLGIAQITGDANGITQISVIDEGDVSSEIPTGLQNAVTELNDYFQGKRTHFDFKLNPKGTEFQQKVWQALLEIPYGKTCSYMDLSKKIRRCQSHTSSSFGQRKKSAMDSRALSQGHWHRWLSNGLCWRIVAQKMATRTRKSIRSTNTFLKL